MVIGYSGQRRIRRQFLLHDVLRIRLTALLLPAISWNLRASWTGKSMAPARLETRSVFSSSWAFFHKLTASRRFNSRFPRLTRLAFPIISPIKVCEVAWYGKRRKATISNAETHASIEFERAG